MPCKGDECCDGGGALEATKIEVRTVLVDSSATNGPLKPDPNFSVSLLNGGVGAAAGHQSNGTNTNSTASSLPTLVQPPAQTPPSPAPQTKPLLNGAVQQHENPRHVVVERKSHPSGLSFEAVAPLPGEELKAQGITDMLNCRVFVSHYRIVIVTQNRHGVCSIPIIGVDSVEAFDETLKIICKDGRIFSVCAETQEIAMNWYKMVAPIVCGAHKLEDVFAFKFAIACAKQRPLYLKKNSSPTGDKHSLQHLGREFTNCGFVEDEWRITRVNEDFKVCASYPQYLIVPKSTTDEELVELKRGRFFDRFPTAVWRSKLTGAVLMRSSQPEVSFFGSPQEGDTKLFEAIRNVTVSEKRKKIVIIDARSYAAAWANRAKGGGFEGGEAYNSTEVLFMSLPNIHSLRYSFHQLRQLLHSTVDGNSYFQTLSTSQWFQYLFNLIISSQRCVETLCTEGLSVLVHCSDGWDRTAQIVSLVKLIADPYYRTCDGFEHLIRREWVEFGHKFSDRNGIAGITDTNERAPVFMQFLDAVHQLWLRNPDMFEFNQRYLMKLAQHQYSGMFGTFLFNNYRELLSRSSFAFNASGPCFENGTDDKSNHVELISVFDYLGKHDRTFLNPAYDARKSSRLVCPKGMWELQVWREVYCCSDIEDVINNPDTTCHVTSNESLHTENSTADKPPTISRSQSAASLNSLEQTMNGIHCNGNLGNHSGTPNGSVAMAASYGASSSSYSTISYISRYPYLTWRCYLDVDGLSRIPIMYEDRIIELQRQKDNLDHNVRSGSESSMKQTDAQSAVVVRHRVESNDSSMFSFEVVDDLLVDATTTTGRRKRDSTCSSNVAFEVCSVPRQSDSLIQTLNEEDRCAHCQKDITDENSKPAASQKNTNAPNRCTNCTEQVIPRSSSQVVVS